MSQGCEKQGVEVQPVNDDASAIGLDVDGTVMAFWEQTGALRFSSLNGQDGRQDGRDEDVIKRVQGEHINVEREAEMCAQYNERMHDAEIVGCAVCGEARIRDSGEMHLLTPEMLEVLRLSAEDDARLNRDKLLKAASTVAEIAGHLYRLEPMLVHGASLQRGETSTRCCDACHRVLVKRTVPQFSLLDFGQPARVGLEPLSFAEVLCISPNRLICSLVKLSSFAKSTSPQRALRSHVVSIPHDGPVEMAILGSGCMWCLWGRLHRGIG